MNQRSFIGPVVLAVLLALCVFAAEGVRGFAVFANLEALAIVVLGTAALFGSAYPLRELFAPRSAAASAFAAHCAAAMGLLGTVLGVILVLCSVEDVTAVGRRVALALTSLFFGLLLSEAVFSPMAARRRGLEDPGRGRIMLGLVGLVSLLLCLFVVLYALAAPLGAGPH